MNDDILGFWDKCIGIYSYFVALIFLLHFHLIPFPAHITMADVALVIVGEAVWLGIYILGRISIWWAIRRIFVWFTGRSVLP